jgi:hypothetical protein
MSCFSYLTENKSTTTCTWIIAYITESQSSTTPVISRLDRELIIYDFSYWKPVRYDISYYLPDIESFRYYLSYYLPDKEPIKGNNL